jgi:CRP-like cAMP-binding protein
MATVEALARRVRPRAVAPGEVVVRRGEPGPEFFVIADGRYDVAHADGPAGPLGPGDGFGEHAQLHAAVRTATITAREAGLLYVLDRDAFLAGVGAVRPVTAVEDHA